MNRLRLIRGLFFIFLCAAVRAQQSELPAAITTHGGSRVSGFLAADHPLVLRDSTKGGSGRRAVELSLIKNIGFGERIDPNLENDALLAMDDLRSEQFELREKAQARLRGLGRAALRPLRAAAASQDAEEAARAKKLLGELSGRNAADAHEDSVSLLDNSTIRGEISDTAFVLRTRWGVLKFAVQSLESIEMLKAGQIRGEALVAAGQPAIEVQEKWVPDAGLGAERWLPTDEPFDAAQRVPRGEPPSPLDELAAPGRRLLTMNRMPAPPDQAVPDGDNGAPRNKLIEILPCTRLENAYAPWGALLHAVEPEAKVEAMPGNNAGQKLSARITKSDCEIQFILPGSFNAKSATGREGGVSLIGVVIGAGAPDSVALTVYDRAGRQTAEILNTGMLLPGMQSELLAVRSKTPIVRARISRVGAQKETDLFIENIVFDRVVDAQRGSDRACVWLTSGERLSGKVASATEREAAKDGLKMQSEFLDEKTPQVEIGLDDIERFEPARAPAQKEAKKPPVFGRANGVLLQSGESFRARLLSLNEKEVLFVLPGGVELKLPRQTLRKIDLYPARPEPGEPAAPTALAADEKPGVDFMNRQGTEAPPDNDKNKDKEKNKNPNVLNSTQALKRIDNAEILRMDMAERELTINDDGGEWTIGAALVKTLVFPENPAAKKAQPRFRDWVLILREGSRFEIAIDSITGDGINAEMAGGVVKLPGEVIESVERRRR